MRAPKNYLNNKDLLAQVILSKTQDSMTNEFANMLMTLVARYASKGNFSNYSYNDDMQSYALVMLCKTWKAFNEQKSSNPFAFYTQCIKNSFKQYIKYEKRIKHIKDKSLLEMGLHPSYSYLVEHDIEALERREALTDDLLPTSCDFLTNEQYEEENIPNSDLVDYSTLENNTENADIEAEDEEDLEIDGSDIGEMDE